MGHLRHAGLSAFAGALLAACSGDPTPRFAEDVPVVDVVRDVPADLGVADVPVAVDAPGDVVRDAPTDAAVDATMDATTDVALDAAMDSMLDAAVDVTADVAGDAPPADVDPTMGCPSLAAPVDTPGADAGMDTWAGFTQGFLAGYCIRCHDSHKMGVVGRSGAPDDLNWDMESIVRANLARIRNAVGVLNYMPIGDPLPTCVERRRLVRWIDLGAP